MESFLISRDDPPLNKNKRSLPLEIFDNYGTKFQNMISGNIDSSGSYSFILKGILLLHLPDFDLVACDFVRIHLIAILKQNVNFYSTSSP